MEILKFRTSAENPWIEIAAIKGDKGDSYTLTEEDKKDIAGLVNDIDLSDYALKTELPDVSEFITEDEVRELISDIDEFMTEDEVIELIQNTESGLTAEEVQAMIDASLAGLNGNGVYF